MASTFGAPVPGGASFGTAEEQRTQAQAPAGAGAPNGDIPQNTMDVNDPVFTSEQLDVNLEGNAYERPAPPPDARYRAKLRHAPGKDSQGHTVDFLPGRWGKNQQAVLYTGVRADIIDHSGKYDGIGVFDQSVSTFLQRDGSHKIQTILRNIAKPDGSPYLSPGLRLTTRGWMDLLLQALKTEPEIGIETAWGWSCQACGEEAEKKGDRRPREMLGMAKFPQVKNAAGKFEYSPDVQCSANKAHGWSRAQVRIVAFLPLGALSTLHAAGAGAK